MLSILFINMLLFFVKRCSGDGAYVGEYSYSCISKGSLWKWFNILIVGLTFQILPVDEFMMWRCALAGEDYILNVSYLICSFSWLNVNLFRFSYRIFLHEVSSFTHQMRQRVWMCIQPKKESNPFSFFLILKVDRIPKMIYT